MLTRVPTSITSNEVKDLTLPLGWGGLPPPTLRVGIGSSLCSIPVDVGTLVNIRTIILIWECTHSISSLNVHSTIGIVMRSYAPYDKTKQRTQAGDKKKRAERYSTEWDVRIDCDDDYATEIVNNLKNSPIIKYCLVSGREQPDTTSYGSKDVHIHIAIILEYGLRRDQVLGLCRGLQKRTDEYCTPRNRKYTYAGWYLHHTKLDWKIVKDAPIRYERGTLPEDDPTEENKKAIQRLFKKFSMDDETYQALNRIKFAMYLD